MAIPKMGLTDLQKSFLQARRNTETDGQAASIVGVNQNSVSRWKREDPEFALAYEQLTVLPTTPMPKLTEGDRNEVTRGQIESLTQILPVIVQEHVRIALQGARETDRMRAIEKIYEIVGFGTHDAMPVSRQNQVFITMMTLIAPQLVSEAERKGLPVSSSLREVLEGEFRPVYQEDEE